MKLRNKKTGMIGEVGCTATTDGTIIVNNLNNQYDLYVYNSLAELNEEWEDYEDELFYIVSAEHKSGYICALKEDYKELCDVAKELGFGFETEKEAEKAVQKLKAFKRLKDKGFEFLGARTEGLVIDYDIPKVLYMSPSERKELYEDLRFVFGGEE